jgi:hypothetical protein
MNIRNTTLTGLENLQTHIAHNQGITPSNKFIVEIIKPPIFARMNEPLGGHTESKYGSEDPSSNPNSNWLWEQTSANKFKKLKLNDFNMENLMLSVKTAQLPSKSISTTPMDAPGPERKYPYNDIYEDLTVGFLATNGSDVGMTERRFFDAWMSSIVDNETMEINFSDDYSTTIKLHIYDQSNYRRATYAFDRAWPLSIGTTELSHEPKVGLMEFTVTFSFDRWQYDAATKQKTTIETSESKPKAQTKKSNLKAKSRAKRRIYVSPEGVRIPIDAASAGISPKHAKHFPIDHVAEYRGKGRRKDLRSPLR